MKGNFDSLIQGTRPVIVDFHALWCGPCKVQSPVLQELAEEYGEQIRVIKVDVDKNPAIAGRFQIRGVPTLILFKNGQQVFRQSGVMTKARLKEILNKIA